MGGKPGIGDRGVVDAVDDGVDPAPGRSTIAARADDVEQVRKFAPDPGSGIVLVRDRMDAQLGDQPLQIRRCPAGAQRQQRLGQRIGPAPAADPQGPVVASIERGDDPTRSGRILAGPDCGHAIARLAGIDHPRHCLCSGIARIMSRQIGLDLRILADQPADRLRRKACLLMDRGRGHEPFQVDLVRVEE